VVELDIARCRLRLTEQEIAEVRTVRVARPLPAWAGEALDTVADPGLRIVVRVFTAARPLHHSIWATPRVAVVGEPTDDGRIELSSTEPVLIPFTIARIVGLRRRPVPPGRSMIRMPASVYTSIQDRVGSSAGLDGRNPQGIASPEATLEAILRQRLMSWRATSAWRDETGQRVTVNVNVTDAGEAGFWRARVEEPESPDPMLLVEPSAARDVWAGLTGLLPRRSAA
jgi:hypothetical protein